MVTNGAGKGPRVTQDPAYGASAPDADTRSLWQSTTDLLSKYVFHSDRSLLDECKFRVHARRQSKDRLMVLLMAFGALVFLVWPS